MRNEITPIDLVKGDYRTAKQAIGSLFNSNGGKLIDMTEFGKPQPCRNKCGAWIYFDSNSKPAHSSPDKWIPLRVLDRYRFKDRSSTSVPKLVRISTV